MLENLTFSGLQRYVRISECVVNSDAFLSPEDRLELAQTLIHGPGNPSPAEIELACQKMADDNLGFNMTRAGILRNATRY